MMAHKVREVVFKQLDTDEKRAIVKRAIELGIITQNGNTVSRMNMPALKRFCEEKLRLVVVDQELEKLLRVHCHKNKLSLREQSRFSQPGMRTLMGIRL